MKNVCQKLKRGKKYQKWSFALLGSDFVFSFDTLQGSIIKIHNVATKDFRRIDIILYFNNLVKSLKKNAVTELSCAINEVIIRQNFISDSLLQWM